MPTPPPPALPGRKKVPSQRRFSERVVFRLRPAQYDRLAARAARHGQEPNDFARDRALGRVRPTRALRRLGEECTRPLGELAQFVEFAHALLPHLEPHFDPGSEIGQVVRRARRRFPDPPALVGTLRTLIEEAAQP